METLAQLIAAGRRDRAIDLLTDFGWLVDMLSGDPRAVDAMEDAWQLLAAEPLPEAARAWWEFIRERFHLLRNASAGPHKALLQLAVDHADDSPVTRAAENWLRQGHCDWAWLRAHTRASHVRRSRCLHIFHRDPARCTRLVCLPGGEVLAMGHALRVWDPATGRLIREFGVDPRLVRRKLELEDNLVAVARYESTAIEVWNTASGTPAARFALHREEIGGMVALEGSRILSWSRDQAAWIWCARTGSAQRRLEHPGPMRGALPLEDGSIVTWDSTEIRLWGADPDPETILRGSPQHVLQVDPSTLLVMDSFRVIWWSLPGRRVIARQMSTAGLAQELVRRGTHVLAVDCSLHLVDNERFQVRKVEGHGLVSGALFLPDGRFVSWSADRKLRVALGSTGEVLHVLSGHEVEVTDARAAPGGRVLSWARDGTVRLWNPDLGTCITMLPSGVDTLGAVALDAGRVVTYGGDVRVWDIHAAETPARSVGGDVVVARVLPRGRLLTFNEAADMGFWPLSGATPPNIVRAPGADEGYVGMSILSDRLGATWTSSVIHLWDLESESVVLALEGHSSAVHGVSLLAADRLLSWGIDDTVRVWSCCTGACMMVHREKDLRGAVPWGPERVILAGDRELKVLDLQMARQTVLPGVHPSPITNLDLLPDGRAISFCRDEVRIWDVEEGRCVSTLRQGTRPLSSPAFLGPDRPAGAAASRWRLRVAMEDGRATPTAVDEKRRTTMFRRWLPLSGGRLAVCTGSMGWVLALPGCELEATFAADREIVDVVEVDRDIIVARTCPSSYCVWQARSGRLLRTLDFETALCEHPQWLTLFLERQALPRCFDPSPRVLRRGRWMALQGREEAFLVDGESLSERLSWIHPGALDAAHLLEDGTFVVLRDGEIVCLEPHVGNRRATLEELGGTR